MFRIETGIFKINVAAKKLSTKERDWVLNDALSSTSVEETFQKLNFESRLQYHRYLKSDPELYAELKQMWLDSCPFLEIDMLNVHKKCPDHKLARIRLEALIKVLAFRDPAKYGPKMDLNVNQNLSMRIAIETANTRIFEMLKEATPILIDKPK